MSVSPEVADKLNTVTRLDHQLGEYIVSPPEFRARIEETVAYNLFESVRLEGNPLALPQVRLIARDSLAGRAKVSANPPSREISNHLAVWLLPDALSPPWDVRILQGVHRELMTKVDPKSEPGLLRTSRSSILSDQNEEVFLIAPPTAIPGELESLLRWLNEFAGAIHPVAAGAIMFHEFESIHPFVEGNGRTGRVLLHAYLQCRGLNFAYRTRLEVALLSNSEAYYRVLTWTNHAQDYSMLLDYFSQAALEAYEEAVDWFSKHDIGSKVGPMEYRILQLARRHGRKFLLRDARVWIPDRGDQTVRGAINRLVADGYLSASGNTRARSYRFVDPFESVLENIIPLRKALGLARMRRISGSTAGLSDGPVARSE
jgi:Fic family protein